MQRNFFIIAVYSLILDVTNVQIEKQLCRVVAKQKISQNKKSILKKFKVYLQVKIFSRIDSVSKS